MFSSIDHMLGFKEEPFIKEALDSRATRRESSVVAEGRELDWTRCCISLARDVASGSMEPTGGTRVSGEPDASIGVWGSRHWHEVYTSHQVSKHQPKSMRAWSVPSPTGGLIGVRKNLLVPSGRHSTRFIAHFNLFRALILIEKGVKPHQ